MGLVVAAGLDRTLREGIDVDIDYRESDLDQLFNRLQDEQADVDVFVLGTHVADPIRDARRTGQRYKQAGILIIVPPEKEDALREALRFAPFLPEFVRYVRADKTDEVVDTISEMRAQAQQRRHYGAFVESVRGTLPQYERGGRRTDIYLDVLLQHAPIGVVLIDDDDRILDINAEAKHLLDLDEASAPEMRLPFAFAGERRTAIENVLQRARQSPGSSQSIVIRCGESGLKRDVEVTAATLSEQRRAYGRLLMLHDVTDRMEAQRAEAELQQQRAVARALEDQAAELQRLNEDLARSNKELQEFAYVASHDLQEPLRKIATFADLLVEDHVQQMDDEAVHLVERLQAAALRMRELIQGLLAFSRIKTQTREFALVDLNEVVEDVLSDLTISIRETESEIDVSDLPEVEADVSQMRSLFQNLISNSLKFRKPGVKPRIRISADRFGGAKGDARYRITLTDNGIGFEEEMAEKIFSPFLRLHSREEFEGTGMGLAICRRIVERHGGAIYASSRPGEGTTFTIELPERQNGSGRASARSGS